MASTSRSGDTSSTELTNTSGRTEIYIDTPTKMIWDALVRLLCAISRHITISDEAFDDVLDMLDPILATPGVKDALDKRNADAVWLRLYKKSKRAEAENARGGIHPSDTEFIASVRKLEGVHETWGFVKL